MLSADIVASPASEADMKQLIDVPQFLDLRELQPSDRYGWSAVVRNTLPLFGLLALAPMLAARSLAAAWSLAPLIGLFLYRVTIVMHDCTHGTLFHKSRVNERVGRLLGGITGVDFHRFKSQHWQHHRRYGHSDDPQGFHYFGVDRLSRRRFVWHVIKPLLGANLTCVLRESAIHPRNLWRALRRGDAAIAMQLVILVIVSGGGRYLSLSFLPFVSAVTFGLFLSQLRGLAEHGPLGNRSQEKLVRSHSAHALERLVLYDLHFNYHMAHHRWPGCPSRHLPLIHERYLATHSKMERTMFATLLAIGGKSKT
jgi:fatty acid desaturase